MASETSQATPTQPQMPMQVPDCGEDEAARGFGARAVGGT